MLQPLTQASVELFHKHTSIGLEVKTRFGKLWAQVEEFLAFLVADGVEEQLKRRFRFPELVDPIR